MSAKRKKERVEINNVLNLRKMLFVIYTNQALKMVMKI